MKTPLRNVLSFGMGDAGSRVIGFLITVYLARTLGTAGFGVMSLGLAVLGHLAMIASPGIQVLETRNIAATSERLHGRVGGILMLRLLLAVGITLLTWAVARFWLPSGESGPVILVFVTSLLPMALFLDWYFQGKERFLPVSVSRIIAYAVYGLAAVLLVRGKFDAVWAGAAFLFGNWAATLFLFFAHRREYGEIEFAWEPALWKSILLQNLPVGIALFLAQMVVNLPPVVIGIAKGNQEVGIFSAAMKVAFLFLLLDRAFNALFLPVITRYLASRKDEVKLFLSVTLKILLLVMLPLTIAGVFFAPVTIAVVFGQGYEGAVVPLQILMFYVLLTVINTAFACTLLGAGRELLYFRITATGALALGVVTIVLTILAGVPGASAGVVAGEATIVLLTVLASRGVAPFPGLTAWIRPVAAGLAMAAGCALLQSLGPWLSVPAGFGLYVLVILVSGGVDRQDIRYLREKFI